MTTEAATPVLRRNRDFAVFWAAQAISRFGDPITLVVLAYVAYVRTGSALLTAIAVLITTVPSALFGLMGGAIADTVGYRRAMVASESTRAILIGSLPVLIGLDLPIWTLYAVVFGAALAGAVFNPARFAMAPAVISPSRLTEGNALLASTDRTVEILGALAAGGLLIALGPSAFYVDAATFAVSALLLSQIRLEERRVPFSTPRALVSGALDGLRFIRRSQVMLANTIVSVLAQLSLPIANGLTPVLLVRKFAAGNPELGATQFAIAEATLAAGAVVGSMLVNPLTRAIRKGTVLSAAFAAYGLALVLLSLAPRFELALLVFAAMGVANVVFYVPNVTIAQENTPEALRARVIGARIALLNLSWLPAIALAGSLADVVPVAVLIGVAGVLTAFVGALALFIPVVRDVR